MVGSKMFSIVTARPRRTDSMNTLETTRMRLQRSKRMAGKVTVLRRTLSAIGVLAGVLLLAAPTLAGELAVVGEIGSKRPVTSEASKKIVSGLRGLIADLQTPRLGASGAVGEAASRFSSDMLRVDGTGRIQVYVFVTEASEQTLDSLRRHGLDVEIVNSDFAVIQGWVPVTNLEALAAEPVVLNIRPPSYARAGRGPVVTEGDSIHRCDQARSLGFDGTGVKVGVTSTGITGLAASQAAGELGPVEVIGGVGSEDEGTAMLEVIADCAPGTTLAYAQSGTTSLAFVQDVNALRDAGAQIIVDDILFVRDPYFEDGLTALNDRKLGAEVLRVTLAGNYGLGHYLGVFSTGSFDPVLMGTRHDFGGGDELLRFEVPQGLTTRILLQWNNQFGAAADDYDLCVRGTNGALLTCSTDAQTGTDDPFEGVIVSCPDSSPTPCTGDIQVTLFAGFPRFLVLYCEDCLFREFNDPAFSIHGQSAVPELLTVAASPASNPEVIEPYSSAGPVNIFFPSIEIRSKPDLTGIDCVATSRPDWNPFCGTSAAAPHVAAVAAILLQRMGPETSVQALRSALLATATDLGRPGFDFTFGAGRADALTAVQSPLLDPSLLASVLPSSRSVAVGATATVFGSIANAGFITASGCKVAPMTNLPGTFVFQTTDPATNQVTGTPDTPASITGQAIQTYVLGFTPTAPFPPTEVQLSFTCANSTPAAVVPGLNTLLLSASSTPVPDIVALAATPNNDGIVNIAGASETGVFAVATVNVGAGGGITVSADTGATALPIGLTICETNPGTGACLAPPSPTVTTTINAGATPTFGIFVTGAGTIPFAPAINRVFVRFKDAATVTRGSTSVAVRTQ
jgi:subtilisin family serine protease